MILTTVFVVISILVSYFHQLKLSHFSFFITIQVERSGKFHPNTQHRQGYHALYNPVIPPQLSPTIRPRLSRTIRNVVSHARQGSGGEPVRWATLGSWNRIHHPKLARAEEFIRKCNGQRDQVGLREKGEGRA